MVKTRYKGIGNAKVFKQPLSSEAAYFLGLLTADGWILRRYPRFQGQVALELSDKAVVKMFNEFISGGRAKLFELQRYKDNRNYGRLLYRVGLSSEPIYQDLLSLGLQENKSVKQIHVPFAVSNGLFNHYVRGLFDGDGCFSYGYWGGHKGRYLQANLMFFGCKSLCEDLRNRLIDWSFRIMPLRVRKDGLSLIQIWRQDLKKFYDWLYSGVKELCLSRKKQKIEDFLSLSGELGLTRGNL